MISNPTRSGGEGAQVVFSINQQLADEVTAARGQNKHYLHCEQFPAPRTEVLRIVIRVHLVFVSYCLGYRWENLRTHVTAYQPRLFFRVYIRRLRISFKAVFILWVSMFSKRKTIIIFIVKTCNIWCLVHNIHILGYLKCSCNSSLLSKMSLQNTQLNSCFVVIVYCIKFFRQKTNFKALLPSFYL